MRVLLCNPPVHQYAGVLYKMNPPLALPILAAVLNGAGHTADAVDLEALGIGPDALPCILRDGEPDWIGFTCLTSSARGVRDSIAALKQAGCRSRIVVGGVHATLMPQDPLNWGADLVIRGECEGNIVGLLEEGATGIRDGKANAIWEIPAPDWEHHAPKPHYYWGNAPHLEKPEAITMWSRGCPHACIFCGNAVYAPQRIRYRPVAGIRDELAAVRARYGVRSLFVYDDELVGHPMPVDWLPGLADGIGDLGLTWKCQGRCSRRHVTPEVCADLYRAGCRVVMWGVESFSQRVLNAIRKGTRPEDAWHSLRTAKAAGLKNWLFTMVGSYGETEEDLATTAQALQEAWREGLVDYRQTTVVEPLPGTELWRRAEREGWLQPPSDVGPQMHSAHHGTPWLSADRIAYWQARFAEVCPAGCE